MDEAVFDFGSYVDSELEKVSDTFLDTQAQQRKTSVRYALANRLAELLGQEIEEKGRYRDPAELINRG